MPVNIAKRILLVTFSRNLNYGGALQEYALFMHLKKKKHEVECLDYADPLIRANSKTVRTTLFWAIICTVKNFFNKRGGSLPDNQEGGGLLYYCREAAYLLNVFISDILDYRQRKRLVYSFKAFWGTHASYTKHCSEKKLFLDPPAAYDVYLAGSDQIWNPVRFGLSRVYFLCFAPENSRKISYASSFGNFHLRGDNNSQLIAGWLSGYSAVSVREAHSRDELKKLGVLSERHIDPTLLLSKKEWISALNLKAAKNTKRYLLAYAMSKHYDAYDFAIKIARELSLDVIIIGNSYGIKKSPGIVCLPSCGPAEFVELFAGASFIVTNSFHGTAFSVNFNIPFLCTQSSYPERMASLLDLTGLSSRFYRFQAYSRAVEAAHINMDFTYANNVLTCERERAFRYLERALESG